MAQDLFDLVGRVAVVTGGLGQIGTAFTEELLRRGMKVALISRHASEAKMRESLPAQLIEKGACRAFSADITQRDELRDVATRVADEWGPPHVLVNNAGIDTQPSAPPEVSGPFEDFPVDVFREVVDVNLTGTFIACQVFGSMMAEAGRGSIINVGSIYGRVSPVQDIYAYKEEKTGRPFIKPVAYSASKSGIYNLTRYLATYWGKRGVRVNTLTPSGVYRDTQDEEFVRNYCARMPIGRMASADEFNGALVFLASDASRYMTGADLVVDGGWTAW